MNGMMNGTMMGAMGAWMLLGLVATLALLTAIVTAGVWVARRTTPGSNQATQILKQRYATGEIDDQEYQRRLAGLQT